MDKIKNELEIIPRITYGISHAYGDFFVAARYCGLKKIPKRIPGEWQHGNIIPERNIHPEFVIGSDGLSRGRKNKTYFVARQDQVDYLKSEGFQDVTAVGLPIIYEMMPKIDRMNNSLLIMPVHSTKDSMEEWNEEVYASFIDKISHQFSKIVCCIHKNDWDKGYWKEIFKMRNIEVIIGADESDVHTFKRLAYLFSRFEYVTSNGFGSHLAYAAFFGAKPSVAGPRLVWRRKDFMQLTFYKNCPELLGILELWQNEKIIEKQYPFLYVNPREAKKQIDWANFQLGLKNKKTPEELKKIFKWNYHKITRCIINMKYALIKNNDFVYKKSMKNKFKFLYKSTLQTITNYLYLKNAGLLFENSIFTHVTTNEKVNIHKIIKSIKNDIICVEIGSYLGASSCFMASAISSNSKLICIDTWKNQNMKYDDLDTDPDEHDTYDDFVKNTEKYSEKILKIRKWSTEAILDVKKNTDKIDYLFIDGDHNYEGVKTDWELYSPLLKKGSIVAFHDTGWADGVKKVINEDVLRVADLIKKLPNLEFYQIRNNI